MAEILKHNGFHCGFCGIPVVRAEIRTLIQRAYPAALRWGDRNADQHAGIQGLWLRYDHLLPYARGGDNSNGNVIITCAPCNNGRSNLTLEQVGHLRPPPP